METVALRRERPLPVRAGGAEVILVAADVNLLIDSIERFADGLRESYLNPERPGRAEVLRAQVDELQSLQEALATACSSLADPPLVIDTDRVGLLRKVLAEVTGYQRGELTAGLRALRLILAAAVV
jgi:hypothetical protein